MKRSATAVMAAGLVLGGAVLGPQSASAVPGGQSQIRPKGEVRAAGGTRQERWSGSDGATRFTLVYRTKPRGALQRVHDALRSQGIRKQWVKVVLDNRRGSSEYPWTLPEMVSTSGREVPWLMVVDVGDQLTGKTFYRAWPDIEKLTMLHDSPLPGQRLRYYVAIDRGFGPLRYAEVGGNRLTRRS